MSRRTMVAGKLGSRGKLAPRPQKVTISVEREYGGTLAELLVAKHIDFSFKEAESGYPCTFTMTGAYVDHVMLLIEGRGWGYLRDNCLISKGG